MDTVKGIDRILLFRRLSDAGTAAAAKLAFQTEHEATKSRDIDGVATKDGTVRSVGPIETEISVTSILGAGDTLADDLETAFDEGEIIEIWDIHRGATPTGEKYPATYYQAYMSEFAQSTNAEDDIELSMSFAVNGLGQKGDATLTADQAEVVQYAFKDTVIEVVTP